MIIKKLVKKHGIKGLLIIVGDNAVKFTKSKEDDKIWKQVKKAITYNWKQQDYYKQLKIT